MTVRPQSVLRRRQNRLGRRERREMREFRDWIEHTGNLIHVSVLIFLPLLIGLVSYQRRLLRPRVLGASTDRSAASRFLSQPTFQRVSDVDADVAIVHRG